MQALSETYARTIDAQVERLLCVQKPNGVFQPEGESYHLYDQYVAYPLALAWLDPTSPYFRDGRVFDAVCRSGDLHAREMDEDGRWPLVTKGGDWGSSLDEWRMHFWLESLLLVEDDLDAPRRERWEEALRRGAKGLADFVRKLDEDGEIDFRDGCVAGMSPNHLAWYMLASRRAGMRYGEHDWVERADRLFADMVQGQNADGFWFEYGAPAVMYNYVSLLAMGVYLDHLGESAPPEIGAAVERGMDAQLAWTYPGGGLVAEIDGRNRYRPGGQLILPAACARWPRGAAALRESARRLRAAEKIGGQALAFLSETARYLARHEQPDETPARLGTSWRGKGIAAGWRRRGAWQATLSGIVRPPYSGRFLTDVANLVGLYHEGLGLLAGGGGSKDDPEWATFTVRPGGGEPVWQPDKSELAMDEAEDAVTLSYGAVRTRASVRLDAEGARVRLERLTGEAPVTARLLRPLPPGACLKTPDDAMVLNIEQPLRLRLAQGGDVTVEGATYALPAGATFVWPRMPFNPYNRDGVPDPGEAFAAFEVELGEAGPTAAFRISEV